MIIIETLPDGVSMAWAVDSLRKVFGSDIEIRQLPEE